MICPTTETLEKLALGFLEDPAPAAAHAASCPACAKRLEVLGGEHAALAAAAKGVALPRLQPPRAKRPARRPESARPWKPFAAAAACLLGALFLWLAVRGGSEEPPPVSRPAAEVRMPAPAAVTVVPVELAYARSDGSSLDLQRRASLDDKDRAKYEAEARVVALTNVKPEPAPAPLPALVARESPKPVEPAKPAVSERPAGEVYKDFGVNPAVDTSKETLSTFALDVDTASYAKIRDYLKSGALPPREAVRVEECLNYFRYLDAPPPKGEFALGLEAAPSPFDAARHLVRVAVLAREVRKKERKDFVLTLVVDVSGSMAANGRLELVKDAVEFLVGQMRPADRIGVAAYSSSARKVLETVKVGNKDAIVRSVRGLFPQDSTNVDAGLRLGYQMAAAAFDPAATNRVILFSDGVANTGATLPEEILEHLRVHADRGIWLTAIGVGMGNYNDVLLEKIANSGNGNYAYVDDLAEAQRVFGEKLLGTMEVVAIDAKAQVEFDPATVASFRLLGYENRHVANRDFRNDKVDAGEVGAGDRVTALYEVALKPEALGRVVSARLRYKEPGTNEMIELPPESLGRGQVKASARAASPSWRLAACVAQFAEVLRESPHARGIRLQDVLEEASRAAGEMDRPADAMEFVELVRKAIELKR